MDPGRIVPREKVELHGVPETLLVTLYGKALDSRSAASILRDGFADALVGRIDYDFARLRVSRNTAVSLALRARCLDGWTRDFIAAHPDALVLNLGCGLDSRVIRVDPPPGIAWCDVDLPDVVALRERLYPARPGCRLIAASVTDPDWLADVPRGRPTMIVAEGLLLYLRPGEVRRLLLRLVAHAGGGELAFDGYSRLGITLLPFHPGIRATGAAAHWGLDDARSLERVVPGLTLVDELTPGDLAGHADMPPALRWLARASGVLPVFRRLGRILRYRF